MLMLLFKKLDKYVVLTWLSRTIWQSNGSGFSESEIAMCNTEQRKSTPRGSSRHSKVVIRHQRPHSFCANSLPPLALLWSALLYIRICKAILIMMEHLGRNG